MIDILKTSVRLTFIGASAFLIVSLFLEDLRAISAAVILGGAISAFNAYSLIRKIETLGELALNEPAQRFRVGTGMRIAMVLTGALIASRYPELFHLPTVLLSCFLVQITALVVAIWHNKKDA